MVKRLTLSLEQQEYSALLKTALEDLRNPADQARYILKLEFSRRGLLDVDDSMTIPFPRLIKGPKVD